jgi:hypothetical protein
MSFEASQCLGYAIHAAQPHPLLFYMLDLFLADFVYAAELFEKEGR